MAKAKRKSEPSIKPAFEVVASHTALVKVLAQRGVIDLDEYEREVANVTALLDRMMATAAKGTGGEGAGA